MLPKHQRLNLNKSFRWVAAGTRAEDPAFKLFSKTGQNINPLIGVAVSKAVFKGAVGRNKAKRLFFEAIRLLYPRLLPGLNLVIMPKDKSLVQTKEELSSMLALRLKLKEKPND